MKNLSQLRPPSSFICSACGITQRIEGRKWNSSQKNFICAFCYADLEQDREEQRMLKEKRERGGKEDRKGEGEGGEG